MRPARSGLAVRVAAVAMLVAAGLSAAAGQADASAVRLAAAGPAPSSGGTWGTATEVPGTAALNAGGFAEVNSVSCVSAGNCGGGGFYLSAPGLTGHEQAFVDNETDGTWGTAIEVPGLAALNTGGNASVVSVSCATARNCSAGGYYGKSSGAPQAFVVREINGTWESATEVPGIAGLSAGRPSEITAVSCASAGNCSAGGYYEIESLAIYQAFVVTETGGTWGKAIDVPGLSASSSAETYSVSCASAGNCSAGGYYTDASGSFEAYVVNETAGTWGKAIEVPGTAAFDSTDAEVDAVSCASAGNCSAAGSYYIDASTKTQAFVVSETGGTWGKAIEVPGTAALNAGGFDQIYEVSCASAGNCAAGGSYTDAAGNTQSFVVSEAAGTWGTAIEVPGTAALNSGGYSEVYSVSCGTAGNCGAGGYYTDASNASQAFVVSETGGTWGTAIEVPGTAALNTGGDALINSVSCTGAGNCSAGGTYANTSDREALVVGRS
jgi:hypothetical protein